jgi:myo-inositol-1(or 4)-monophosphatase
VLDWPGHAKGFARQLDRVSREVAGIRRLGTASLDLAYVAAGRFDGFWEYGLKAWDMAAGIVLVREAGGLVGRLEGDHDLLADGTLLAANPAIYPRLGELLAVNL